MADPLDFLPAFSETLARIRARMDADVNAGIDPTSPAYIDTREGSFYWDLTQVTALEIVRLWDALASETIAAAFVTTAWGEYLDSHGSTFNLTRNPAIAATGVELFIGDAGVLVPTGTQVSALPSDPSLDAITFTTTNSGTTSAQLGPPSGVTVTPSGSGGSLTPNTYYYHVTTYTGYGETPGSPDQAGVITTGTGSNAITWGAVTGAVGYRIYRSIVANSLGNLIADLPGLAYTDTGAVSPGAQEPTANQSAGVRLPIIAQQPGSGGNLAAAALNLLSTVIPGIETVTNEEQTSGGADVEADDPFRSRIIGQYQGQGAGNQADYVRWSLAYTGVERANCIPIWDGPGTVLVIVALADGTPVASTIVTGLQNQLDPISGLGHGQAPIGAVVTVATTVPFDVNIAATVNFAPGYTYDGAGGTIATRAAITTALTNYLQSLNPGDTIGYQLTLAAFFQVEGVIRVPSLTINSGTSDIVLSATDVDAQAPVVPPPVFS